MKNRIILLIAFLCLGSYAAKALQRGDFFIIDNLVYRVTSSNTASFLHPFDNQEIVTVPSQVKGRIYSYSTRKYDGEEVSYTVTGFGDIITDDICYLGSVRKLTLPNTITSIYNAEIIEFYDLEEVTLPQNLEKIPSYLFAFLAKLKTVRFPSYSKLKEIGENAFSDCPVLEHIQLPNSLEKIGEEAFEGCSSLKVIEYGSTSQLKQIGAGAFKGCTSLEIINSNAAAGVIESTLPNRIERIEAHTFEGCAFTRFAFPKKLLEIRENAFSGCKNLTKIALSQEVYLLENYAFSGCSNLETVVLPASLTIIGGGAFQNSNNIRDIYNHRTEPVPIDISTFDNSVYLNAKLYVHNTSKYKKVYAWSEFKHMKDIDGGYTFHSFVFDLTAEGNGEVSIDGELPYDLGSGYALLPLFDGATVRNEHLRIEISHWDTKDGITVRFKPDDGYKVGKVMFGYSNSDVLTDITNELIESTSGPLQTKNGEYEYYVKDKKYSPIMEVTFVAKGSDPSTDPTIEPTDSVTLIANSYSRQYGDDNPTFDYTVYSGKVKSGTPTITCAATNTSPVGTCDIIIEKGSVSNKHVTLVNGKLTITKAPLTISVGNYSKVEGEANPSFTVSYSGFKNGETKSVLTKQPTISCSATTSSAPGTYSITVSGAESQNYDITYKNGTLTVTAKQIPPVEDAKPYVVYNNGTLTFYCDNQRSSRQGTTYDLNKDTKNPDWLEHKETIEKAVFDISFANARPTTTRCWFYGCSFLTDIVGIGYLNTSDVENMSQMFRECKNLNSLDVDKFNTSKVTDMAYMFESCNSLTSLDVSNFYTSKVTNMTSMFFGCKKITSIDVGNFNTDKVTNMRLMFAYCQGLTKLDLHNFNTANVTDMSSMFDNCSSLAVLDVSSFNTAKVTTMTQMFLNCSNLISIDISRFNTSNVTKMASLFSGCSKLTNLNVSNFNTANVTSMNGMFNGCNNLINLDVSHFNTEKVTNMTTMFNGCSSLTGLDVSSFNTGNVTNVSRAFKGCENLTNLIIGNHFTSNESTNVSSVFNGCSKLNEVTFTGDIPSSINSKFFEGVGTTTTPATLVVPDVYNANYLAKFDGNMFYGGYFKLGGSDDNPPVGDTKPYAVYNDGTLTFYCDNQRSKRQGTTYDLNDDSNWPQWGGDHGKGIIKAVFDTSFSNARPTTTYGWFIGLEDLTEVMGMENLNTSEVTNMGFMFGDCSKLSNIDLSHFDTKNVTSMTFMFYLSGVQELDLSSFDTRNTTSMMDMFYLCHNLSHLTLGNTFVTNEEANVDYIFSECYSMKKVSFTGDIPSSINSKFFNGVGTADAPATLDVPDVYKANYQAKFNGNKFFGGYFTLGNAIEPNDGNGGKDYGNGNSEIDDTIDLNGNVIGNVYYQISPDKGGYNSAEGCLVVTEPSSDADFDYENLFGDEFKNMFTGIVIMVQSGSGTIKVEAETTGGMTLKVKVGKNSPITMSFQNKSTMSIPYTVTRPSYVYIYAGGPNATRAAADGALKIYRISWESSDSQKKKGDMTGDGEVNGTDLVLLANQILEGTADVKVADLNGDGVVNGTDLVKLVNMILGKE